MTSPSDTSFQTSAEAPIATFADSGEAASTAIAAPPYVENTYDQTAATDAQLSDANMGANTLFTAAGDFDFGSSFDFTTSLDPLFFFPDTMAHMDFQPPVGTQAQSLEALSGKQVLANFA